MSSHWTMRCEKLMSVEMVIYWLKNVWYVCPYFPLGRALDVWLEKMVHVTQDDRKKLLSLALVSLLTSGAPVVLERIFGIFVNVTETLNDITRNDEETGKIIEWVWKMWNPLLSPICRICLSNFTSVLVPFPSICAAPVNEFNTVIPPPSNVMKTSEELAAEGDDYQFETEHDSRKREALLQDPTNTINLRDYFQVTRSRNGLPS